MNPVHIHLWMSHVPIIGSFFASLVLMYAIRTRSNPTKMAAYYLFLLSAISAAIAYNAGEEAEEILEKISGISEQAIERHEDFAGFSLASAIILGISSLAGMVGIYFKKSWLRKIAVGILFLSLINFLIAVRTGYLGGKIRHSEINTENVSPGKIETDDD